LYERKLTAFAVIHREVCPFVMFGVEEQYIYLMPYTHKSRESE